MGEDYACNLAIIYHKGWSFGGLFDHPQSHRKFTSLPLGPTKKIGPKGGASQFSVALRVIKETTKRNETLGSSYLYIC